MDNIILGTQIPCGHPFTPEQVKNIFDTKTNTARWRKSSDLKKVFSRSKNGYVSDEGILSLTSIKRCGSEATNMLLTLPFLRKEALNEWQNHWPDTCAPELYVLNAFCKKYYQKPYFCIEGDCLRNDLMKEGVHCVNNHELAAASTYFAQVLRKGDVDVSLLIADVFTKIHEDPIDQTSHHALWAICSIHDCSLPIQYLLYKHPELERYYDFLDWFIINDIFADENCIEGVKSEYRSDINFYTHYPHSLHSGFVDETIKSHTKSLICDTTKKLFIDNTQSVYHSHHSISDYSELISSIKMTKGALDLYFDSFFDEIVSNSLTSLDKYIEDRELCAHKFKDTTGEDKLPNIDLTEYHKAKEKLFTTPLKRSTVVLNFESEEFKSAIEDIRSSLEEPFKALEALSKKYASLAADPIKNRKPLTELLKKIDEQVDDSVNDIQESDKTFLLIVEKIGSMISRLQKKDMSSSNDKINELQKRIEEQDSELYQKSCTIERLNKKLEKSSSTSSHKEQSIEVKVNEIKAISTLIKDANITPKSVLETLSNLYPDNLVVLDTAYASAKEVEGFRQTHKMFDMLNTLITSYLPSILGGNPDTEARKCFGAKAYAANESKTVSSSQKLMHYRQFKVDGNRVEMQQHLNIGIAHDQLQTMRIYFKIIDGKVYLGYAGKHLPNK